MHLVEQEELEVVEMEPLINLRVAQLQPQLELVNTGGGGAGAASSCSTPKKATGNGGSSGIVIIRYKFQ